MSTVHTYKHVGRCKATFAIKYNFSLMYVAKNRIVASYKNVWHKHSNHEGKKLSILTVILILHIWRTNTLQKN